MKQTIVALISLLLFLGSSGVLRAMFTSSGGILRQSPAIRRSGSKQLRSEYRSFGLEAFAQAVAGIKNDLVPGRKIGAPSDVYRKRAGGIRRGIPAVPVRDPFERPARKNEMTETLFSDIDFTPALKGEYGKAAQVHALLVSRRDRFSDDS